MSVPGMMYPTQKGMIGATPAMSAYQAGTTKSQSQALANNLMAGGKFKKRHRGGTITVPQMQINYTPQGGTGTNPNAQIAANSATSTQSYANAKYDNAATKMSGGRRSRRRRRSSRRRSRHTKRRSRRY